MRDEGDDAIAEFVKEQFDGAEIDPKAIWQQKKNLMLLLMRLMMNSSRCLRYAADNIRRFHECKSRKIFGGQKFARA